MKRSRPWVSAREFRKDPSDEVVVQKFASGGVVKAEGDDSDDDPRVVKFIISDGAPDRDNDAVAVAGWNLDAYRQNPVVLWAHNRDMLPIAKAVEVSVEGDSLVATAEFDDSEFADRVLSLYRRGFMSAVSVGFRPLKWKYDEERDGYDFVEQELVEFSAVPVPANPRALVAAAAEGLSLDIVRGWVDEIAKSWPEDEDLPESLQPTRTKIGDVEIEKGITIGTFRKMIDECEKGASEETLSRLDEISAQLSALAASVQEIVSAESADSDGDDDGDEDEDGDEDLAPMFGASLEPTVRWNKSLSEVFDVREVSLDPERKEEELAAGHCGCGVKDLFVEQSVIPSARMGGWLLAFDELIAERGETEDLRNVDHRSGREIAPVRQTIQLNSKRSGTFVVEGIHFLDFDGMKAAVSVSPSWYGLHVRTYAAGEDGGEAMKSLADDVSVMASSFALLKGEAFSLSGEFIERGETTLDDLFATEKNEAALRRTIEAVAEGPEAESRGLLFVGPPGTGKTLSGRILMNECADATFVWLSARDFYYGGGFQSLEQAFEIAREYAPAILFIEDVDSYLTRQATDFLKTAMDGLVETSGVFTVLTSNYPEQLPAAIVDRPGRFHDVLRYDLPNADARKRMLARWLPELEGEALDGVIARLSGFSGAHIREFARFVSVLRRESELPVEAAADGALAKLDEQRDVITAARAKAYRPPPHVLAAAPAESKEVDALEVAEEEAIVLLDDDEGVAVELLDSDGDEVAVDGLAEIAAEAVRVQMKSLIEAETRRALDYARGRV